MPTLPVQPHHEPSAAAESFGVDAERYDRTRPRYPDALVDRIVAESPGPDVLDVGCGTGIAARQFRAAGCTVLGVEPDAADGRVRAPRRASRSRWRRSRPGTRPAARSTRSSPGRPGTGWTRSPVRPRRRGCCDPAAGWRRSGTCSSPRPRSPRRSPRRPAGGARLAGARTAAGQDRPWTPTRRCSPKAADGIRTAGGFGEPEQWRFDWERTYTRDEWLDQLPTSGALTRLPPDRLAEVVDGVGAAIDAIGGGFTMPYVTVAVTATVA